MIVVAARENNVRGMAKTLMLQRVKASVICSARSMKTADASRLLLGINTSVAMRW